MGSDRASLALEGITLRDGHCADVYIEEGAIVGIDRARSGSAVRDSREMLSGFLLLPGAAEPHAHLDKALLGRYAPNRSGDIRGALQAMQRAFGRMSIRSIRERALASVLSAVCGGFTAIRSHVNCEEGIELRGVAALCSIRAEVADFVDLQVVAMPARPVTGREGANQRAFLRDAIELGVDVVGGVPEVDESPVKAMQYLLNLAVGSGLGIDLHLDETTDPGVFLLREFARSVAGSGMSGRATASHCVSLGQQPAEVVVETAELLASAGVAVVTLPQTNLWLQGRDQVSRVPRGVAPVGALRRAGVVVAAGGDNRRDPFNPLGRYDPLDTAALLVAVCHVTPEGAYDAVSVSARMAMGLPQVSVDVGYRGDLLAVRAGDVTEALASAVQDRVVIRAGRVLARSSVVGWVDPGFAAVLNEAV